MIEPEQKPMRSFYPLRGGPTTRAGKASSATLPFGHERSRAWVNMGQSPIPP